MLMGNMPREYRNVEDFTPAGKTCLARLKEQIKVRLPPPKPNECMATLLDPATKKFAEGLLGTELHAQAVASLKAEHRKVFMIIKRAGMSNAAEAEITEGITEEQGEDLQIPTAPNEESDDEDDLIAGFSYSVASKNTDEDEEEDLYAEADELVDNFLAEDQVSNSYLLEGATRLPEDEGARITINQVIASFDTRKYYNEKGSKDYPALSHMARIQFSRMENSGFQERVFSTGGNAMTEKQARMDFDQLEQRVLLSQNQELIEKKII